MKTFFKSVQFILTVLSSSIAIATPEGLTFQGRLTDNGVAIEDSSVEITLSITSPGAEACVLFEEKHTLNLTNSGGIFSLKIGGGSRTGNDKGFNMVKIFSNSGLAIPNLACATGNTYTPAETDTRKVFVSFSHGSTTVNFPSPYVIQSVPYAIEAQRLAGKDSSEFLQTVSSLEATVGTTQARINRVLDTDYSLLNALLSGTSNQYLTSSSTAGTTLPALNAQPSPLSAGQMWYQAGAIKYYDGSSSSVKTLGSSSGTVTSVSTGAGLTGGPISTTGTISLEPGIIASTGTYKSVTVDTYGRITAGTNPTTVSGYGITDAVVQGGQSGEVTLGSNNANPVTIKSNGSPRMTFLSSGYVGIGTTSPTSALTFSGSGAQMIEVERNPSSAAGQGLTIQSGGASTGLTNSAGGDLILSSGVSTGTGTSSIYFKTATAGTSGTSDVVPSTKMTILASGNVGIGTPTPNTLLHVFSANGVAIRGQTNYGNPAGAFSTGNGDAIFGTATGGAGVVGFSTNSYGVNGKSNTGTSGFFRAALFGNSAPTLVTAQYPANTADLFRAIDSGGDILFRISYTGNVGIGTSAAPEAKLDINGFMKLSTNAAAPAVCTATLSGSIALTSLFTTCVCKGSTTTWVSTVDGTTSCAWH